MIIVICFEDNDLPEIDLDFKDMLSNWKKIPQINADKLIIVPAPNKSVELLSTSFMVTISLINTRKL